MTDHVHKQVRTPRTDTVDVGITHDSVTADSYRHMREHARDLERELVTVKVAADATKAPAGIVHGVCLTEHYKLHLRLIYSAAIAEPGAFAERILKFAQDGIDAAPAPPEAVARNPDPRDAASHLQAIGKAYKTYLDHQAIGGRGDWAWKGLTQELDEIIQPELRAAEQAEAVAPESADEPQGVVDWHDTLTGARGTLCTTCGHETTDAPPHDKPDPCALPGPPLNPHEDCCGQGCAVCQPSFEVVPKAALDWLNGESPEGFTWPEGTPLREDGFPVARYWWRSEFFRRINEARIVHQVWQSPKDAAKEKT